MENKQTLVSNIIKYGAGKLYQREYRTNYLDNRLGRKKRDGAWEY